MSQAATTSVHHVVHVQLGTPRAPAVERLSVCYDCPYMLNSRCTRSSYFANRLFRLVYVPSAKCPDGRW